MGLEVTVLTDNDISNENGEPQKVPHDKDPSVLYVQYPSLYDSQAAYAIPTVKVEISVLSMSEPYEMRRISSLIEQTFKDEDVDSDKELPATIQIVPSDELMSSYEADYNEMKESFIYGQPLTFSELMEKITNLQEQFRALDVPKGWM